MSNKKLICKKCRKEFKDNEEMMYTVARCEEKPCIYAGTAKEKFTAPRKRKPPGS